MSKYFKYLKTICVHKWYVFIECVKLGIVWQGIIHDMSKFYLSEFIPSAKYYNGESNDIEYQRAWLHHKGHNKHHWEYWVDWDSKTGEYILSDIPIKYLKEIYADMIGASKAYNKGNFDNKEPLKYFTDKCKGWKIKDADKCWLEYKFKELANK